MPANPSWFPFVALTGLLATAVIPRPVSAQVGVQSANVKTSQTYRVIVPPYVAMSSPRSDPINRKRDGNEPTPAWEISTNSTHGVSLLLTGRIEQIEGNPIRLGNRGDESSIGLELQTIGSVNGVGPHHRGRQDLRIRAPHHLPQVLLMTRPGRELVRVRFPPGTRLDDPEFGHPPNPTRTLQLIAEVTELP